MPLPPIADRTDRDLMLAVRGGDLAALDALFVRHHGRLYGFLARLTGNRATAEDLVQEVFLRVLRARERYHGDGSFTAWLFRIARNVAAGEYGTRRETMPLDDRVDVGAAESDPIGEMETAEDLARLERALLAVAPQHREVLLLRGVEDLSHREVGEVLGCTEGAARVRVHRALNALRNVWIDQNGGSVHVQ
jgi:RNA polymerase sigma factor (sigma-70 family)